MMKRTFSSGIFALSFGLLWAASALAGPIAVDPALPGYQKTSGVSGNLNSIGSDTLNNLKIGRASCRERV